MGRSVVVANGAQHEAGAAAIEKQPNADHQRDGQVDERVLTEQDSTDQRQIGQNRQMQLRGRRDPLADEAGADQSRQAGAEDRERKTARDLVDGET